MNGFAAKTRTDAWGENLPEDLKARLYAWTKPPAPDEAGESMGPARPWLKSYEDALRQLSLEGVVAPSRAGWYRFLGRMRRAERLSLVYRVASSAGTAKDVAGAARVSDAVAAETFKALAVDAAMAGDEKTASLYAGAASAIAARLQKDRELALRREKFEAAEKRLEAVQNAVKSAKTGGLTPETLKTIEDAAGLL